MALTGFSITPTSIPLPIGMAAAYVGYTYYKCTGRRTAIRRSSSSSASTGQILLIPVLMTPLTYIAAAANLPMQDAALMALDRALGLDWMAYFNFVYHHHALLFVTVLAYSMIGWPVFGVPIALGWTGRYRRMQEFTLGFRHRAGGDDNRFRRWCRPWAPMNCSITRPIPISSRPAPILSNCAICHWCVTGRCASSISTRSRASSPFRAFMRRRRCSISGRSGRYDGSDRSHWW